uniref:DMT family transporter n=1 Tax=Cohnella rhizosphaerae TaxID=1457232 RepID=UPI0030B891E2
MAPACSGPAICFPWYAFWRSHGSQKETNATLPVRERAPPFTQAPAPPSPASDGGLAAGAFSYGGLQLYAVALARGPAHLVAPIFAANSLVVVILSLAVYRERLSVPQIAALICLLGGLVLIRI